ncbi:unnamed protein product [Rotaria sp. Silwood2]|nr:unnamed protein product [Rotaria sp. Silwood2]
MVDKEKNEIISFLSKAPSNLTVDDLDDFCSLANHYASNTPQSFRKEFYSCLFSETDRSFSQKAYSIYQALCLPVFVQELLQANQLGGTAGVRYFIVDCRPAEQYNSKHLYTAFHLDANLLLEDPKEFAGTVDALFATQRHAIDAGSAAAGEHLCFIGSGHEEEDKYVRMVVAYFLRRNTKYVSIASGGYEILAKAIEDPSMLIQPQQSKISTAVQDSLSLGSTLKHNIVEKLPVINTQTTSLINMISSAVKTKSIEVKDKVKDYITHTSSADSSNSIPKHVSKQDKVSKLYRQNQPSVFSLDEEEDDDGTTSSSRQHGTSELVDIESWFLRSDLLYKYECEHFDENDKTHPSLLLVSSTHLYILRKLLEHKTMANLVARRPLNIISKITSKKNFPEIITFRYAANQIEEEEQEKAVKSNMKNNKTKIPIDCDKVYIPDAEFNNNDEYLNKKKVRFNLPNDEQQSLECLFVSETFSSTNQLKPYTKFLYNLGFDLCLNENFNNNNYLSQTQKQILIKQNDVFYHNQIYSCKYCSFKTNTIHVMDHHYRTPHILSNSMYNYKKYRCTYCSFQTFRLPELRRHVERKHGHILITEPSLRHYRCCYCSYETDDKNNFLKHNNRCQIDQERTRMANNLLAPFDQSNRNIYQHMTTTKPIENNKKKQTTKKSSSIFPSNNTTEIFNSTEIDEPILIESDHDTLSQSSSDEDFIVSSDEESSSDEHDDDDINDRDFEIPSSSRSKKSQKSAHKTTTSLLIPQSYSINSTPTTTVTNFSSLSKLLLLNGTPITTFTTSSINSIKPPLVAIQPKPTNGNDIYQMCNICQCYIYKKDYIKHMKEKHNNQTSPTQQTNSSPLNILNNTANNINTSATCLTSAVIVPKPIPQPPSAIFLLSTATMNPQSIKLDMIKCPWCDTNFEHIDIMTGHLMR